MRFYSKILQWMIIFRFIILRTDLTPDFGVTRSASARWREGDLFESRPDTASQVRDKIVKVWGMPWPINRHNPLPITVRRQRSTIVESIVSTRFEHNIVHITAWLNLRYTKITLTLQFLSKIKFLISLKNLCLIWIVIYYLFVILCQVKFMGQEENMELREKLENLEANITEQQVK